MKRYAWSHPEATPIRGMQARHLERGPNDALLQGCADVISDEAAGAFEINVEEELQLLHGDDSPEARMVCAALRHFSDQQVAAS